MKLVSLLPIAFGRFHADEPIALEDGLNIIVGDNESGKSTLGSFILGMLYGFKKEGRTRISRTPEFERYRPWSGSDYRGAIVYQEDGRIYRVERWFDPDITRIYDEITGEDITNQFLQDSRKEYNFTDLHLGLTAKEFRNTIWIGQLQSSQDADLGLEIQGKLENILQGGAEDLSFARALAVLNTERAKIQTPRTTRGELDIVEAKIAQLEIELNEAREREAEVRKILVELRNVQSREQEISRKCREYETRAHQIRSLILHRTITSAEEIEASIMEERASLERLEWAKDIPDGLEQSAEKIVREEESILARIRETKGEIEKVTAKKETLLGELEAYEPILATNIDESGLSGLHSRYLACKASTSRAERHANEARRELVGLEEKEKQLGFSSSYDGDSLLSKVEELQEILVLAEREKARCDMEIEKASMAVSHAESSGGTGWIYAISLAVLGIAIAFTVMGLPLAFPAFGISVIVFGIGSYRHMKVHDMKYERECELEDRIREGEEQAERVVQAKTALEEFLALQGARSVEELRSRVREISAFYAKLEAAKEQYEVAHRYWFECSQEFSACEKELTSILVRSGCLVRGQSITDVAVESFASRLKEASSLISEVRNLNRRIGDLEAAMAQFEEKRTALLQEEKRIFEHACVSSRDELNEKITAHKLYLECQKRLSSLDERLAAVLSGRNLEDLRRELEDIESRIGKVPGTIDYTDRGEHLPGGYGLTEKDYQEAMLQVDKFKEELGNVRAKLASLEKEAHLRQIEGRPVYVIEEELVAEGRKKRELSEDKDALELALKTLEDLSRNLRREFAPVLKERVGGILEEITGGKYFDVRISPDLEMSVIDTSDGRQVPVTLLSAGTMDQCYFALRVAVAELIVSKKEFPFFFDDSFVQYDEKRLEGVLKIIAELAKRYQILLFSCHGREVLQAQRMRIPCNIIRLDSYSK